MNRLSIVAPALLVILGCLTRSSLSAQDETDALETVLFPVQSGDARSLVDPIRLAFGNEISVSMIPTQQVLVVRLPRGDRDELIEMLQVLSPAPHTVRLEVFLLGIENPLDKEESNQLNGPVADVRKQIRKLQKEKGLTVVSQAELSVLEQTETHLDVGQSVPIATATNNAGGRVSKSYSQIDVGIKIQTRVRVVDGHVLMDFDLARSTIGESDSDEPSLPATQRLTQQSTLRIKDGHAHCAGRMTGESKRSIYLIVAAAIDAR